MKTLLCALSLLILALTAWTRLHAQEPTPIPTLAAPTLVPVAAEADPRDTLISESALADIVASGLFRVGALYNEAPFSEYTLQGDLRGFDIDLTRLIAEVWGIDIEFVQITRQNALDKLNSGQVHAVASAFVRYRDLDEHVDFSQSYYFGAQAMLVRAESGYQSLAELSSRRVGYVIGTRAEKALSLWSARLDASLRLGHFWTLDRAFSALTGGEIEGLVAEEQKLLRVAGDFADRVRMLDEDVLREPRAFAVRRHDAPLRNLLSHTIQSLAKDGALRRLHGEYFPETEYPEGLLTLWDGISDEPTPAGVSAALQLPARFAMPHILAAGVLRVGGISENGADGSASQAQLAALNRALVAEMADRWGAALEIVASDPGEAAGMLASGDIDIAVGVKPDWRLASSMEFSAPYLLHGDRLMTPARSQIGGFNDLRGRIIGIIIGDGGAQDRAQAWADSINASVRYFQTREDGAALQLLEFNNAHAVYADSLLLIPHLQASPSALRLTDRWYSRAYYALGLPYNDRDFRLLVNYSLQELARDGTLWELSAPFLLSDEPPDFEITPGAAAFAGISLAASR